MSTRTYKACRLIDKLGGLPSLLSLLLVPLAVLCTRKGFGLPCCNHH